MYFSEFLAPGAHDPVNVDCRVAETVRARVENSPDRYCFEEAEVFLLVIFIRGVHPAKYSQI